MTSRAVAGLLAVCAAAWLAASCAHAPRAARGPSQPAPPPLADSVTCGLWRFDEAGGPRVIDSGPFRLNGTAGLDARTTFGRFGQARTFSHSIDAFVYVPYNPVMDSARGFTVEAWVRPTKFGDYELTMIAARWSPIANEQSWALGVIGRNVDPSTTTLPSPGYFREAVFQGQIGRVVFTMQPAQASSPQSFLSTAPLELDHWTHVAATCDGEVVKLFIDGRLDAQYAIRGGIRPSPAALLIGNVLDTRYLTDFAGELRYDTRGDANPYYAFEGDIDEVRLSSSARLTFESTALR